VHPSRHLRFCCHPSPSKWKINAQAQVGRCE
jgi:hypothetical protein